MAEENSSKETFEGPFSSVDVTLTYHDDEKRNSLHIELFGEGGRVKRTIFVGARISSLDNAIVFNVSSD